MPYKFLIKLAVTFILFSYVFSKVNWHEMPQIIQNTNLTLFFFSYLLLLLSSLPMAFRLKILLKPTVFKLGLRRLIEIQFISQFYGAMMPAGIGIAIARWYKVTENKVGRRIFFTITILERAMLLLPLLAASGLMLIILNDNIIKSIKSSALPIIGLLFIICFLFLSCFWYQGVYRHISKIFQWLQSKARKDYLIQILDVYKDSNLYFDNRNLLTHAFFFSLLFQLLFFIRIYLIFIALNIDLSFTTILWVSIFVVLLINIPISFAGFGMRESGFALMLSFYGISPAQGMLVGGLMSLQVLMHVGIGAILNILEKKNALQTKKNEG